MTNLKQLHDCLFPNKEVAILFIFLIMYECFLKSSQFCILNALHKRGIWELIDNYAHVIHGPTQFIWLDSNSKINFIWSSYVKMISNVIATKSQEGIGQHIQIASQHLCEIA